MSARLAEITLGDPRNEATRMGPLVNRAQQAGVLQGIGKLSNEATIIYGGVQAPTLERIDGCKSAFVSPTLLKIDNASKAQAAHETEIFGPAATIIPYKDEAELFALVALGGGSLVVSVFGDDLDFLARAVTELGASNGRVLAVDPSVAEGHSGHGIVMPQNAITADQAELAMARSLAASTACGFITSASRCKARPSVTAVSANAISFA